MLRTGRGSGGCSSSCLASNLKTLTRTRCGARSKPSHIGTVLDPGYSSGMMTRALQRRSCWGHLHVYASDRWLVKASLPAHLTLHPSCPWPLRRCCDGLVIYRLGRLADISSIGDIVRSSSTRRASPDRKVVALAPVARHEEPCGWRQLAKHRTAWKEMSPAYAEDARPHARGETVATARPTAGSVVGGPRSRPRKRSAH